MLHIHVFTQVHVEFNSEKDMIVVEGPPEEVEKARDQLEKFSQQLIETMSYEEVKVPQKFHRFIIGKNGQTGKFFFFFF